MHSTVRTSRWSASASAGGRVCGVTTSSWLPSRITSASRTTSQPDGMRQVVSSTFVPGTYSRPVGWLVAYGASRKLPASRSSRLLNTLGASKLGTQSQSTEPSGATSAPVWQSRSEEHTSELQSRENLVCRLLLE